MVDSFLTEYPALLGLLLVVATVFIHTGGTVLLKQRLGKLRSRGWIRMGRVLVFLPSSVGFLLILHILHVLLWQWAYLEVLDIPELDTFEESIYFSIVTYTTLGYGDIVIAGPWRILGGIQAMNGILMFGWSTALLFDMISRINELPGRKLEDAG
jgi:hypothetical protein